MTWFLGDPHFHCPRLAKHRGFASMEDHDDFVMDCINGSVQRNERLIILGDFCGVKPGRFRQRIKAREVWLIWGNHDKPSWKTHFSQTDKYRVIKLRDKFHLFLAHYPTAYWDGSHKGWGHVYGHTHYAREATLDAAFPGRRSMDVGFDALRKMGMERPINEDEVSKLLQARPGHDDPEFYRTNFGVF